MRILGESFAIWQDTSTASGVLGVWKANHRHPKIDPSAACIREAMRSLDYSHLIAVRGKRCFKQSVGESAGGALISKCRALLKGFAMSND